MDSASSRKRQREEEAEEAPSSSSSSSSSNGKRKRNGSGGSSSATPFGNYRGYYSEARRNADNDPRVDQLQPLAAHLKGSKCLDVGCNDGTFTRRFASAFGCRYVLGVDIDAGLIHEAWKGGRPARKTATSKRPRIDGSSAAGGCGPDVIATDAADHDHEAVGATSARALPSSSLRDDPFAPGADPCCFRREDFANLAAAPPHPDRGGYDAILALSVTKWVHLSGGDAAVERFFAKAHALLRPGGVFVLEPQDWASYRKQPALLLNHRRPAEGRGKTKKGEGELGLRLRPEHFPDHLLQRTGFATMLDLSQPHHGRTAAGRPSQEAAAAADDDDDDDDEDNEAEPEEQEVGGEVTPKEAAPGREMRQTTATSAAFTGKRRLYAFFKAPMKAPRTNDEPHLPSASMPASPAS